jgi:hypothetical protein
MWRSHFVVLGEEPEPSNLAKLADGYQLWLETQTGLYYITAHSEPLGSRPDFGDFLERSIEHRLDVSVLKRFISNALSAIDVQKHEISFDLIQQAATLSKHLAMPVLAAEDTDDEYGMAVMVDSGVLKYLRFKTMASDASEVKDIVEVVYTLDAGFMIDTDFSRDIFGVTQKAIQEVFGRPGLRLYDYCISKPIKDEARKMAAGQNVSIKSYLDGYGVFKRLRHAPPRLSPFDRALIPFRYVTSVLILPFIFVGVLIWAVAFAGKGNSGQPKIWVLALTGMAALAPLIWLIIWLARAVLGY